MNRRSLCDCEHCTQNRLYREQARQAEVTQLYENRVSPRTDRQVSWGVTLLFALSLIGVAASWWVHR